MKRLVVYIAVVLASCILASSQTTTKTIHVSDARPLTRAIEQLEQRIGVPITYEDPDYIYDLEDITKKVRWDLDEKGNSQQKVLAPRGGEFEFRYRVDENNVVAENIQSLLNRLVHEYNQQQTGAVFAISGRFHVVPAKKKDASGKLGPVSPLLNSEISIPFQERTGLEMLNAICDELSRASGHTVFIGSAPISALARYRANLGASARPAREVLSELFGGFRTQISWQALYDPGLQSYAINVHAVGPGERTEPKHSPTAPPGRPRHLNPRIKR